MNGVWQGSLLYALHSFCCCAAAAVCVCVWCHPFSSGRQSTPLGTTTVPVVNAYILYVRIYIHAPPAGVSDTQQEGGTRCVFCLLLLLLHL